jgi:multicomponent Na+:H+ antiporter subunit D
MSEFPPALVFLLGAPLIFLAPMRARSFVFVCLPAIALGVLFHLHEGSSTAMTFLDFDLRPMRVDRLSLAFGYVFVLISFLGGVYAFHLNDGGQQVAAAVYAGSALGAVFAGDFLTLFVCWELMAIASAYLIFARRRNASRAAGMRYLLVHLFGGSVLMAGILWRYSGTGSLVFDGSGGGAGDYLILLGFSVNAAIPPLHAWLSDAYPEGTVTGSVFLSAFTTKTAVYALARGFAGWDVLIWAGVIMAIYGVVFAVLESDIRRLLAYHIISQVGYMVTAVGVGTDVAINAATAHAFCHILYKGLLFMGAGAVLYSTGRSKLTELGGLVSAMPLALSLYMIGAFSISGFPLFSGFVSKSLAIHAAELEHEQAVVLLLYLASVGTFLHTGLKLPYFTWFGPKRTLNQTPIPWNMHVAMVLAAAINLLIGVYPKLLYDLMPFPVVYRPYTTAHVLETLQLLAFTGLGFWFLIDKVGGKPTTTLDFDWFYRKPAPILYRLAVVSTDRIFTGAELLALDFARRLAAVCANPVASASRLLPAFGVRKARDGEALYDENLSRAPAGFLVLLVLFCFIVFLACNLFAV